MSTIYETKLRKARIDTDRIMNGLEPIYADYEKELNPKQARIHNKWALKAHAAIHGGAR